MDFNSAGNALQQIRTKCSQCYETARAIVQGFSPLKSIRAHDESIKTLLKKLLADMTSERSKPCNLLDKKVFLLIDLALYRQKRDSTMTMNSERLANDFYWCHTEQELDLRLECKDVPVMVRNELKVKLEKVK